MIVLDKKKFPCLTMGEFNVMQKNILKDELEKSIKARENLKNKYKSTDPEVVIEYSRDLVNNCFRNIGL